MDRSEQRRFSKKKQVAGDQLSLSNSTQSALARAVVAIGALTEKLNPVIKPLMDSIRTEENSQVLQPSLNFSAWMSFQGSRPNPFRRHFVPHRSLSSANILGGDGARFKNLFNHSIPKTPHSDCIVCYFSFSLAIYS